MKWLTLFVKLTAVFDVSESFFSGCTLIQHIFLFCALDQLLAVDELLKEI